MYVVYVVIPKIVSNKRKLIKKDNRYFNADGEDISSRVPSRKNFMIIDGLYFVFVAIAMYLIAFKTEYYHISDQLSYSQIIWSTLNFSAAILIKNLYFFGKDLPTASYFYFVSRS